jgi:hypothetical protein
VSKKVRRMEKQVHRKRKLEWMNKEFQEIEQLNMLHESRTFFNKN